MFVAGDGTVAGGDCGGRRRGRGGGRSGEGGDRGGARVFASGQGSMLATILVKVKESGWVDLSQ